MSKSIVLNPKSEIRNPKQFSNFLNPNDQNKDIILKIKKFENSNLFRISNFVLRILIVACCIFTSASASYAQPLSTTELINNAKEYDGQVVVYEGEVIGDIMVRGDYAWVNVNDGKSAIGIWADKNLTKDIFYTGSYKAKGDWIEVTGVFHRACAEHGGDLDIHALTFRIINPGSQRSERINAGKKNLALILLSILFLIWILRRLKRK